jgi:hypothetical protein
VADLLLGGGVDPASHERVGTPPDGDVVVPTDSLTTHAVIVGMTGSGKTGLERSDVHVTQLVLAWVPITPGVRPQA